MLKYLNTAVTFSEIPDEISLCINITNCPNKCKGCHSPYLAKDIGEVLDEDRLKLLISSNKGITCVCFMGGDSDPHAIYNLAGFCREVFPTLKVAWYSGKEILPEYVYLNIHRFDYIKLGPYDEKYGPLNNKNTNQRLYQVREERDEATGDSYKGVTDITYKFWK